MITSSFNLPELKVVSEKDSELVFEPKTVLIVSEGFEKRCLSWVSSLSQKNEIEQCILFRNKPLRKSKIEDLIKALKKVTVGKESAIEIVDFDRFDPISSEFKILSLIQKICDSAELVVIDLSVMSKLLIMILIYGLRGFRGRVKIVYSEPMDYCPSKEEYEGLKARLSNTENFPSYGVHDVVRTPLLSSTSMHNRDACLIAFTSFNERLIEALLASISPHTFILIGSKPPHLKWREKATQELHAQILSEYGVFNPIDNNGRLQYATSTLNFHETFNMLHKIYHEVGQYMRVVVAPTGSKMQTLGVALFKAIYNDIHIEYPMPESFLVSGFSSDEIRQIHCCEFSGIKFGAN